MNHKSKKTMNYQCKYKNGKIGIKQHKKVNQKNFKI